MLRRPLPPTAFGAAVLAICGLVVLGLAAVRGGGLTTVLIGVLLLVAAAILLARPRQRGG